jgi:hypothetical protein
MMGKFLFTSLLLFKIIYSQTSSTTTGSTSTSSTSTVSTSSTTATTTTPNVISTGTIPLPTKNTCSNLAVATNPTSATLCNTSASDKCCFVKNNSNPEAAFCISSKLTPDPKKSNDQKIYVLAYYKDITTIDCGIDSISTGSLIMTGNTCSSLSQTTQPKTVSNCNTNSLERCCFVSDTDSTSSLSFCISAAQSTGTKAADFKTYITENYKNIAAVDCGQDITTKDFPTSNSCSSLVSTVKPKMASNCNSSINDKCCYMSSNVTDQGPWCIDVKSAPSTIKTSADLIFYTKNSYKSVLSVDCGNNNSTSSENATLAFPTNNTCTTLTKNPSKVEDCSSSSKEKCCFVTNTDSNPKSWCVDASKYLNNNNSLSSELNKYIKDTYKDVFTVDCGKDPFLPLISYSNATEEFPTNNQCSELKTFPNKGADCHKGTIDSNCCYMTNIDKSAPNVCAKVDLTDSTTTESIIYHTKEELENSIKKKFKNIASVDCGEVLFPQANNCITSKAVPTEPEQCWIGKKTGTDSNTKYCCFVQNNKQTINWCLLAEAASSDAAKVALNQRYSSQIDSNASCFSNLFGFNKLFIITLFVLNIIL